MKRIDKIASLFKPFEEISSSGKSMILTGWLLIIGLVWGYSSLGDIHMFPTPMQVLTGFKDLWLAGIKVHIGSSLALCGQAVLWATLISLMIAYLTTLPFFKSVGTVITKLRFLPLTGIAFYISILIHDARAIQVWVLVVFMSTFLTTSLIQMIRDIPKEEIDHARTLGCSRWAVLWEVVIKGRVDYVFELIRQNLAIVWMMLVTVESYLIAAGGLGTLIKNSDRTGNNGRVIALQIIIILIGIFLDLVLTKTRKISFRYSNF